MLQHIFAEENNDRIDWVHKKFLGIQFLGNFLIQFFFLTTDQSFKIIFMLEEQE